MHKNSTASKQFMNRSGSYSTHGSRTGRNLLGWEEPEEMTDEQKRESAASAKRNIDAQISALSAEIKEGGGTRLEHKLKLDKRDALRSAATELGFVLRELAINRRPRHVDLGECIIEIIKSRITKPEWEIILKQANELLNSKNAEYKIKG